MGTVRYARVKVYSPRRCRWLVYVFGIYILFNAIGVTMYLLEPELSGQETPILWSAHGIIQRAALLIDGRPFIWYALSAYPWYLLGLYGAVRLRTKGDVHLSLRTAAVVGIAWGLLDAGLTVYLHVSAPFQIATVDGSIVIYDAVRWHDNGLRLAFTYLPFVVSAIMMVRWRSRCAISDGA